MKVVLISTYELGRQPFGLASPAAWLRVRGHDVACLDLSREALDEPAIRAADLIAFYVPMHTATRLAADLLPVVQKLNPLAHFCFYGLYAPVNKEYLRGLGVATILGGEFEEGLIQLAARVEKTLEDPSNWAFRARLPDGLAERGISPDSMLRNGEIPRPPRRARNDKPQQPEPVISLARQRFLVPDRAGLPALTKYSRLMLPSGEQRLVGSTEATRGCKHLCRHCPIVPVYHGIFRVVEREVVLEDIRRQVAAGAQHITFGDPDFFNGPAHALSIVESLHREFPKLTYDVTIKIEHLRKRDAHLAALRDTGCLFVISAVESVNDDMLEKLDKGHSRADFMAVAARFRDLGMTLLPTFVPFTPWTTLEDYCDLLSVITRVGLIENVAPVQLAIRLLIPAGSRLLELQEVREMVGPFDPSSLVFPWKHEDGRVDTLWREISEVVERGAAQSLPRTETFGRIWRAAHTALGDLDGSPPLPSTFPHAAVPYIDEPWYCCAEPTRGQFVSLGSVKQAAAKAGQFV